MDVKRNIRIRSHPGRIAWLAALAMLLLAGAGRDALANGKPVARRLAPPVPSARPLENRLLAAHNRERAAMGVPPLVWDGKLEANARAWATELARTGRFEHARQDDQGENITKGTRGGYTPEEMVRTWIAERAQYRRGAFPYVSKTGNWTDVGHYTQLIWRTSRRVGCAIAANARHDYLVCRYDPPGNWMGEDPQAHGLSAAGG